MQSNVDIARKMVGQMSMRDDPETVAGLFSADISFEIQGDEGALPWIGREFGRQAIVRCMESLPSALLAPQAFDVEDILASETRTAVVGSLQAWMRATGKTIATQFAMVLTMNDGLISRVKMLEDSFDVSRAAR